MKLKSCLTCKPDDGGKFQRRGFTRHADRICSWCRRGDIPSRRLNYRGRAA